MAWSLTLMPWTYYNLTRGNFLSKRVCALVEPSFGAFSLSLVVARQRRKVVAAFGGRFVGLVPE